MTLYPEVITNGVSKFDLSLLLEEQEDDEVKGFLNIILIYLTSLLFLE